MRNYIMFSVIHNIRMGKVKDDEFAYNIEVCRNSDVNTDILLSGIIKFNNYLMFMMYLLYYF